MKANRPQCEFLEAREPLSGFHGLKHAKAPAPRRPRHHPAQVSTALPMPQVAKPAAPPTTSTPAASAPATTPAAVATATASTDGATLTYATRRTNPDVGLTYDFQGTGAFGPLASGNVVGSIEAVGSVASGRAGGTLTFRDGQGAIVLKVSGPVQSSGASLPSQLDYTVWGGYGAYAGTQGTGTVGVQLSGNSASISIQHA